jgi:arylsulfatase A-like enzyme
MRHLYACAIRQQDDWLAAVLEQVDLGETLVIVCSDHGENLGEGGLIGHAYSLDERLTRVPFVSAGPGSPEDVRSLAELPRIVARAAGLEAHPWVEDLPAAAVAQFDAPVGEGDPRLSIASGEWGLGEESVARLTTSFEMATDGSHKLIRRDGSLELVELEADPVEIAPRSILASEAPPELLAALDHPAARGQAGVSAAEPAPAEDLKHIEAQMRTLGYL